MASRLRWVTRTAVATLVGGTVAVAVATPAHAADAVLDVVGSSIYYSAGAGQQNHLVIERSTANTDQYLFQEVGGAVITSSDPACFYSTPGSTTAMTCTAPGLLALVVSLGAGHDAVLNWTDRAATLYGGDGDDTLWFGGRTGVSGWADGGAGNDVLVSGPGNDTMVGGAGVDRASYYESIGTVNASLVTNAGGHSYDTDTYSGIEDLEGGGGADTLVGDGGPNRLWGGTATVCRAYPTGACSEVSGNDTIFGNGGADTIDGDTGNDIVFGGDGNDSLSGDRGDDSLYGEAGNDSLSGGSGANYLHGGSGTDSCWDGTKVQCEN
jgi:Ca2+-binding RTX toxin-like protein